MNGIVSVLFLVTTRRRTLAIARAALSALPASLKVGVAAQTKNAYRMGFTDRRRRPKIINDAAAQVLRKANPGFVESMHVLNDAYKTKLKIAFGANQPPCVFSSWGGASLCAST